MWIIEGKIASSPIPTDPEDISLWKKEGIKAVVILAESHEIMRYWMNVEKYFEVLRSRGMKYLHSPIKDFHAPSLEQLKKVVEWIDNKVENNEPVLIHCHAGIGRTGTVIAAYLVEKGHDATQAIRKVKRKIPLAFEVEAQAAIIHEYYNTNRKENRC
ncbi:MAG: dual specificity protein phosphatase family protein [Thermoproteota archaeon]